LDRKNVLFISGSLGLGHITRDIAIANELRNLRHGLEIEWLAADPATKMLKESGEKLVPGIEKYSDENISAENAAKGSNLNLLKYLLKSRNEWKQNIKLFTDLIRSRHYDLVIGDETYEINLALRQHPDLKKFPFVMIFDFVGLDAISKNPMEHLGVYYWNCIWSHDYRKKIKPPYDLALFVGEAEDIPDKQFGFMLPNRRDLAKAMYTFVGYIFPFDVTDYSDREKIKRKLGYGSEPLLIASIGGTAIGKEMLELCARAYIIAKEKLPDLRFVLVTGPRLSSASLNIPEGIEVRGFVPRLVEHFAACDLAIVQGGATSTHELTALRRPFIYFPLEGHCEQALVANNLARRGAGLRLNLSHTTPEILSEKIIMMLNSNVSYSDIPKDGAHKAAQHIAELIILQRL
jgi:UDP:flavonoid glycosyltransferase YjiC (YdhE family)